MGVKDVQWEVDSSAFHVFVDISQDVDELHLDAEVDGMQAGSTVFIAIDFNQNEANSRGDFVAI